MINLDHLTFSYYRWSNVKAIDDASTAIAPGIHLLLGENGAGKTTLLRLLAGLLQPSSGRCYIDGEDINPRRPSVVQRIFFLPDHLEIPFKTINLFAKVHSIYYPRFNREMFQQNLSDFGLDGNEEIATLSLGMRHKTLLAYVLALGVDLLLLDEPANGLDITSKKVLRAMLARCTPDDGTVIISTHTVSDLRELYDGLIVLSHGKLLVCRPCWEIAERLSCIATSIPPQAPLYMEQEGGMFLSLIPCEDGAITDLNYPLIYSGLLSPSRDRILEIINRSDTHATDR